MVDYDAMWLQIANRLEILWARDHLIVASFSFQNAKPKTILSWKILGKRTNKTKPIITPHES